MDICKKVSSFFASYFFFLPLRFCGTLRLWYLWRVALAIFPALFSTTLLEAKLRRKKKRKSIFASLS